ncbi:hypothetical protein SPACI_048780 [Sporomusa acidovorans DSM 3132]|uniref:Uncharacterized protein n=1 Tax=Sporomusa acidovorans (strain ATCC 49682 / DSM 3132 / Mol) TaxID=1123286 RepID=A0ABZ3J8P9_SPOA4|nr:hypothetical protein SPACI_45240 [Sporomusa acidovorans DSM 3132]SDE29419.1 hypothetical protein SAMN04488499_101122 [Sporomusa acidovorans]
MIPPALTTMTVEEMILAGLILRRISYQEIIF